MEQKAGRNRFREVLIFVAGTTPQIITETIYALIHREQPVYPDEIYIITTRHGEKAIRTNLIDSGIFREFCREFGLNEDLIREDSLIVIKDSARGSFDDIKTDRDNELLGDFITNFIREKARDHRARLHCSLAGGRKTMSFYMGSALQFFGRPWDKLYHVLVSPEFESNPDFYYKPRESRILTSPSPLNRGAKGSVKQLNTGDAEIYLAELPFIRLSGKISLHGRSFKELVEEGQREIDIATLQPPLKVNLPERTVYIGDNLIEMVPVQLMIYTAYLRQKTDHCRHPARAYCLECSDCFPTVAGLSTRPSLEEMAEDYRRIYNSRTLKADELLAKHAEGLDQAVIRQNISKINRTIKEQLKDETLLPYYRVTAIKIYGSSRYGVRVEKGKVTIDK
ncbi:MAG: TIGR02584 family CRISPR-associated protein [Deferribacteres bacterium]|nr:TIGR02584 family CRISPR-associated protein [Deferribacteres bacterium]